MPSKIVNVAVAGAAGRMGRQLAAAVAADPELQLALAFEHSAHEAVGALAGDGATAIQAPDALQTAEVEVLIDFTAPAATLALAEVCRARKIGMVVGSTGFSAAQLQQLRQAGADIPLLMAQNMSVGVNALYRIAAFAASLLGAGRLGGGYDIEICEAHHRHKKDAPSGTALRLGQEVAAATGGRFEEDAVLARSGSEAARGAHDIGFSAVRGGDIVGTHSVLFAGRGEQIEITHRSTSRANYCAGALRAAKFIAQAPAGFYDGMEAVLAPPQP